MTTTTYAIDVRIFLLFLTTAMAIAFGIGIAFSPDLPTVLDAMATAQSQPTSTMSTTTSTSMEDASRPTDKAGASSTGTNTASDARPNTLNERHVNYEKPSFEHLGNGINTITDHYENKNQSSNPNTTPNSEHLPAGQHLLMDMKNLEAAFLNSEERLADAMVQTVQGAGLTLLSYHCHSLMPAGVSCVGVLLESHISFHTWPEEGVITLDLFTCGSNPLLPVVKTMEQLFGIPRKKKMEGSGSESEKDDDSEEYEEVVTLWSHELRGFRNPTNIDDEDDLSYNGYLDSDSDLAGWITSPLNYKEKTEIVSVQSSHQRIDIWDSLDEEDTPSYEDALKYNLSEGDPRWLTSEIVSPDRLLFLDGALQSIKLAEVEYHESLVHPAMLTHANPKNVAIIGGGEGANLREVLKHDTVEKAIMVERDEMLVQIAREHLPFMNDCSILVGSPDNCFDDERATLIYEDARQFWLDHYGKDKKDEAPVEKFDVVIMDALDRKIRPSEKLYSEAFLDSLFASLSDDGIIAMDIGGAPTIHDPNPSEKGSDSAKLERLFNLFEANPETGAMFVYEESHVGFYEPRAFLVVCKKAECRQRWYAEADAIDYDIEERLVETKNHLTSLKHYDGSTQHSFQLPPRAWETVYCRREPMPFECDYRGLDVTKQVFELELEEEEESSFEVEEIEVDGKSVSAVYAAVDIPKGSYIMPSDLAASFIINDETYKNLVGNTKVTGTGKVSVIEDFVEFIDANGHRSISNGGDLTYVEIGGTFLARTTSDDEKVNIGRWMPKHPSGKLPVYSPVYERHMMSFDVFLVATKDIKKGDEIMKAEDTW